MASQLDGQTTVENTLPLSKKSGNNNALTHGGTSQKLILPTEKRADFEALLEGLRNEYRPETQQHRLFVEQLAIGHWFLLRKQRAYNAIESSVYESAGQDAELLREFDFRLLALAERYKVAAERALHRAFKNAESIRKERKGERGYRERHAQWQAEQEIRERRVKLQEQKNTGKGGRAEPKPAAKNTPPKVPVEWLEDFMDRPAPEKPAGKATADRRAPENTFQ